MYPPLNPVDRLTAIPLVVVNQLFNQTFWENGPVTKYGHQAMKISNHMNIHSFKSVFNESFTRSKRETQYVFRFIRNMYNVTVVGQSTLKGHENLRWRVVGDYLQSFTERFVESRMMLRRLRYERRKWTSTDHEMQEIVVHMQKICGQAAPYLADYIDAGISQDLDAYLGRMELLFDEASRVLLRLEREGQSLQHLVVEFVKQHNEAREELATGHMGQLASRISDVLLQTLEQTGLIVSHAHERIQEVAAVSNLPEFGFFFYTSPRVMSSLIASPRGLGSKSLRQYTGRYGLALHNPGMKTRPQDFNN